MHCKIVATRCHQLDLRGPTSKGMEWRRTGVQWEFSIILGSGTKREFSALKCYGE